MTDRSSRTMKVHRSKVIVINKYMAPETLRYKLESVDRYEMKDGLRIVKVLRVRKLLDVKDDQDIAKALERG